MQSRWIAPSSSRVSSLTPFPAKTLPFATDRAFVGSVHSKQNSVGSRKQQPMMLKAISKEQTEQLVEDAVVWANQHGLDFVHPEKAVIHAPVALSPVEFPKARFLQAKRLMPLLNTLVDRVAADEAYLETTLYQAAKYDEFTARLLGILKSTREVRMKQREQGRNVTLGIHRSDYMLDAPSGKFLQVELNTIASSFGCLSSLTTALHRYTCRKAGIKIYLPQGWHQGTPAARLASRYTCRKAGIKDLSSLPDNPALQKIPAAISAAARPQGSRILSWSWSFNQVLLAEIVATLGGCGSADRSLMPFRVGSEEGVSSSSFVST
eukprot:gene25589-11242_t